MTGRSSKVSRSPTPASEDDHEEGDADLSLHIVNEAQHGRISVNRDPAVGLVESQLASYSGKWQDLYSSASELLDVGQALPAHSGQSDPGRGDRARACSSGSPLQATEPAKGKDVKGSVKQLKKYPVQKGLASKEGQPVDDEEGMLQESEGPSAGMDDDATALHLVANNEVECLATNEIANAVTTKETEQSISQEEVVDEGAVMRKLLRGRRYFDPPDEHEATCYNCGKPGHQEANCREERRIRPCYICGDLQHEGWQCPQKIKCFSCGGFGHIARACNVRRGKAMCLKCGDYDHVLPRCRSQYSREDLQQVRCYICKAYGHLSCKTVLDDQPTKLSCYKCGEVGHAGNDCRGNGPGQGRREPSYGSGDERRSGRDFRRQHISRRERWRDAERSRSPERVDQSHRSLSETQNYSSRRGGTQTNSEPDKDDDGGPSRKQSQHEYKRQRHNEWKKQRHQGRSPSHKSSEHGESHRSPGHGRQ